MKLFLPLLLLLSASGCTLGTKSTLSLCTVYTLSAALALVLLVGCLLSVRTNRPWFITLFSCVFIVNAGYALLSVSTNLEMALWANRLSYLGSVFLPLSMLMILLGVSNTPYRKLLPHLLIALAATVFLIAASPGILPIYYKEVSFAVVDGVSTLLKVYGPLHPLYLIYLLGYFFSMVALILYARRKKRIESAPHAVALAVAVLVNIGVWAMEQLVSMDFEMLSVSYLISETFLLSVHLVANENCRLRAMVQQASPPRPAPEEASPPPVSPEKAATEPVTTEPVTTEPVTTEPVAPESVELFLRGFEQLTPTERAVYFAHVARMTTKEILAEMNIKESTLKYHNRNLYGKLGVSSRKELLEIHKHLPSTKEETKPPHS